MSAISEEFQMPLCPGAQGVAMICYLKQRWRNKMGLAKAKRPKRPMQLFMEKVHLCGPHPEDINL